MARPNRINATDRSAWFHVYARAAEYVGVYPLERQGAWRELTSFLRRYTEDLLLPGFGFYMDGQPYSCSDPL